MTIVTPSIIRAEPTSITVKDAPNSSLMSTNALVENFQNTETGINQIVSVLKARSLDSIPAHLNAIEAMEISQLKDFDLPLSEDSLLTFPLIDKGLVEMKISKVVKKETSTILFGTIPEIKRSHIRLTFIENNLTSGSITLFESGKKYLVSLTDDDSLIVSRTNPNYEMTSCGCSQCQGHHK